MVTACQVKPPSITKDMLDAIVEQLRQQVGKKLAVEYYPEQPSKYRLNHADGALLVNYGKSNYSNRQDVGLVNKERTPSFTVTIVSRNLHDRLGAVRLVDWVVAMLSGFTPTHCDVPLAPIRDYFIKHQSGIWYYGVDFDTQTAHVQTLKMKEI